MNNVIIAIDGTSGSGKGTLADELSKRLGYLHLDTGAFYRSLTYLAIKSNILSNEIDKLVNLVKNMQLEFINDKVILNEIDVTKDIRSNEVNNHLGKYFPIKEIRLAINDKIREYGQNKNLVVDGRDIGSVVFPNAKYKFYVDCIPEVRAKRRYEQNKALGIASDYDKILENIISRDTISKSQEFGKLVMCEDAYLIDTTNDSINESVMKMMNIMEEEK